METATVSVEPSTPNLSTATTLATSVDSTGTFIILTGSSQPASRSSSSSSSSTNLIGSGKAPSKAVNQADPKVIGIVAGATIALILGIAIVGYFVRNARGRWGQSQPEMDNEDDEDEEEENEEETIQSKKKSGS